jgi:hypothetical protein
MQLNLAFLDRPDPQNGVSEACRSAHSLYGRFWRAKRPLAYERILNVGCWGKSRLGINRA